MIIHERALIHPDAVIGEGTIIGPDVIIDQHVQIGRDCEIRARAILTGHCKLGDRNRVGYQAIIGSEPQDVSFTGAVSHVEIGNDNIIRENVTVHRGTAPDSKTVIGNRCHLMTGSHLAHNVHLGNDVTLVNNVLLAGHVHVGDFAFLGGDVVVHQFVRIGEHVMVRGQTRIGMDIPPYCMATDTNTVVGLNRVGLKRRGFDHARRRRIADAFDIIFRSNLNRSQAIATLRNAKELQSPDIDLLINFLSSTKRGICSYRKESSAPQPSESSDHENLL